MEKRILDLLKEEVDRLEVQKIVMETTLKIMDGMKFPGAAMEQILEQKKMIESTSELNNVLIASLKERIKNEEVKIN